MSATAPATASGVAVLNQSIRSQGRASQRNYDDFDEDDEASSESERVKGVKGAKRGKGARGARRSRGVRGARVKGVKRGKGVCGVWSGSRGRCASWPAEQSGSITALPAMAFIRFRHGRLHLIGFVTF